MTSLSSFTQKDIYHYILLSKTQKDIVKKNLLTYYIPLLPLWSGIILCTVSSSENATDSNAIVENWFRIVKHRILN